MVTDFIFAPCDINKYQLQWLLITWSPMWILENPIKIKIDYTKFWLKNTGREPNDEQSSQVRKSKFYEFKFEESWDWNENKAKFSACLFKHNSIFSLNL